MSSGDYSVLSPQAVRAELAAARERYQRPAWLNAVATIIEDGEDNIKAPWVGGIGSGMRLRKGGDTTESSAVRYITAQVSEYEDGAEVRLSDLRRDRIGLLSRQDFFDGLAQNDEEHWQELVEDLLDGAAASEAYDGQYFFDDDHADSDAAYVTAQSNDITVTIANYPSVKSGSTTQPSPEDIAWAVFSCIRSMMAFKDDKGRYVNRNARHFMVFMPMTFWMSTGAALGAPLLGYGASNPLEALRSANGLKIEFVPLLGLSWTTQLAVFRVDTPKKAILGLQEQLEPEVQTKVYDPSNSDKARKAEAIFIERRANRAVALGDWRKACLATLA